MIYVPSQDNVRNIVGVAITPNRKYVAFVEEVEEVESQQVTVYSLQNNKKVKTLVADENTTESKEIICIHFSENSKVLLVQQGEPDHTIVLWRWYSGKIITSVRLGGLPIIKSMFSNSNSIFLASVSASAGIMHKLDVDDASIRSAQVASMVRYAAILFCSSSFLSHLPISLLHPLHRPTTQPDPEKERFTSLSWLVGNFLALTTSDGRIQINQDNEVKCMLEAVEGDYLLAICPRLRGFVCAGDRGYVYFFDPTTTGDAEKASSKK